MPIQVTEERSALPKEFVPDLTKVPELPSSVKMHARELRHFHSKLCELVNKHEHKKRLLDAEDYALMGDKDMRLTSPRFRRSRDKTGRKLGYHDRRRSAITAKDAIKITAPPPQIQWLPNSSRLVERIFLVLESPDACILSRVYFFSLMLIILLSALSFIIETLPQYQYPRYGSEDGDTPSMFGHIDFACVVIFTADYLIRAACVPFVSSSALWQLDYHTAHDSPDEQCVPLRKFGKWSSTALNFVDFLSSMPYWILLFSGVSASASGILLVLRVLRLTRVLRVFKMGKVSPSVYVVPMVAQQSRHSIYLMSFVLSITAVVFGTLIFYCERGDYDNETREYKRTDKFGTGTEISPFRSIVHGMWWFVVTSTTLGYGDIYPTTTPGKIIAFLAMYLGVVIVAMPLSIISKNYYQITSRVAVEERIRKVIVGRGGKMPQGTLEKYLLSLLSEYIVIDDRIRDVIEASRSNTIRSPRAVLSKAIGLGPGGIWDVNSRPPATPSKGDSKESRPCSTSVEAGGQDGAYAAATARAVNAKVDGVDAKADGVDAKVDGVDAKARVVHATAGGEEPATPQLTKRKIPSAKERGRTPITRLSMDFAAVGARVDNIVNGLNSEQEYATELLHKCQQGQMILSFELPLLRGMKHTLEALQKPEEDRHRARQVKYLDGNDIRREEMSSPHS